MTAQQALVTLKWFRCMDAAVEPTAEDLEVIQKCILPILKDNNNIIPGSDISYHQMYVQWEYFDIPEYFKVKEPSITFKELGTLLEELLPGYKKPTE
jgi:hypothetical protein